MAEYINKQELLKDIGDSVRFSTRNGVSAELRGAHKITDRIRSAPACDVVEVVRCKDCIYHNVPPCPMRLSLNWTNDNDYCSYGERRLDNDKSTL